MEQERRNIRVGLAVIAGALFLNLAGGMTDAAVALFSHPRVAEFLVYMETGRVVRLDAPVSEETTQPVQETTLPPQIPVTFDPKDAELVKLSDFTGYGPDIEKLLTSPLSWDLTQGGPAVLILHTHATESYAGVPGYRTEDRQSNMLRVGQEIARVLEENGIEVIHDTTLHDKPSYNGSYNNARKTIAARLEEYPSIRLVLDIHRDALELTDAVQLSTQAQVDGQDSAQLMLVMGTDANGLHHPRWQESLAVGVKLHALLERKYPGICRAMQLRKERFNQDFSHAAMIVEVGAAGDTLEKALVAARAFAESVVALSQGAATTDSTS